MKTRDPDEGRAVGERMRQLLPWLPLGIATAALAVWTIDAVLRRVGHPSPTLDDAYIHFQYARAIAEGHPFRYHASAPVSTGATSLLWPAVLSVPYALGFHGDALLWPAWLLSYGALFGIAYEAHRLTEPLAGRAVAMGASAMSLAFGGYAWCAASGMEVVPFAWLIAHATRRASTWTELPSSRRTSAQAGSLLVLAVLAPLLRPEGAITSLVLGLAIGLFPAQNGPFSRRWLALGWVLAALVPQLSLVLLTGSPTSDTARAKLLVAGPYGHVAEAVTSNARLLVTTLLDGQAWSAEFLPEGSSLIAVSGLLALVWRGHVTRRHFRAAAILVLALSMFAPTFYATFLWNRLRYLWPFATGWLVGVACLARVLGDVASRVAGHKASSIAALVTGLAAGLLASKLDGVVEDVAQSASGISRQQASLGKWAGAHLPEDARLGVNDTGALAYFGKHPTFDIVGLTTPGEARYWVAGPASRLEHYEDLARTRPSALPTHFAVYPEWMGLDPLLGPVLHEAVVRDATILGGPIMRIHEARWAGLGSGEEPWTPTGTIVEAVDVADLDSEQAHGYELFDANFAEEIAVFAPSAAGLDVLDGGRTNRFRERFIVHSTHIRPTRAIARVATTGATVLHLWRDGVPVAHEKVPAGSWTEVTFELPAGPEGRSSSTYDVAAEGAPFASFHWWFAAPPP